MIKDCAASLGEVETRIPSVIFAADEEGEELVDDVTVSLDGITIAKQLTGTAQEMNPVSGTFTFRLSDGREEKVVATIKEGEKGRRIAVSFKRPAPPPPPVVAREPVPIDTNARANELARTESRLNARRLGYGLVAAGGVGIIIGIAGGITAIAQNNDANCDENNFCDRPDARWNAQESAMLSTIAFSAGLTLVTLGVVRLITAPSAPPAPTAARASTNTLRVTNTIGVWRW